jgi:outer membrane immunogenic protein
MENKMQKGTMRRVMLAMGLAGATMFGGTAMAADVGRPVYKAPPAGALPVTYDWTGFYVGGHVGYGWADKGWRDAFGFGTISHNADGFLGGGQAGFNYQVGQFVFGAEGDFTWTGIDGGTSRTFGLAAPVTANFNAEVDWTATLTARAGIAFDRVLVYAKGGAAWAHDRYNTNFYAFPGTVERSDTRLGWTAGAGVEYAFAPNWSTKLEYNYMDFGTRAVSFAPGTTTDIDQQIHAVKFGINYKFGGGPIMARY